MARSDTLAPGFLVASPKLDDGPFERAVIVMIHHDAQGAMGFMINKPLDMTLGSVLEMVEIEEDFITPESHKLTVFFGGPVRVEQLWVIHHADVGVGAGDVDITELDRSAELQFHDDWALTGSVDSIQSLAAGRKRNIFRPYIGYAGWGPGQLEEEIADGSWLPLDFDEVIVFGDDPGVVWENALEKLGLDETTFMMMGKAGRA